jgi:hypothetical protein
MGSCEFTGQQGTKKAAPFGATLFKEADWQESEETLFGAVSGEETTGESRESLNEVCQRLRPLYYATMEHLPNQSSNCAAQTGASWGTC